MAATIGSTNFAIPFSPTIGKDKCKNFFKDLPEALVSTEILSFATMNDAAALSCVNKEYKILNMQIKATQLKKFIVMKDLCFGANPPTLKEWQAMHQIIISPFTTPLYQAFTNVMVFKTYVTDTHLSFHPLSFAATIGCSLSSRKRFVQSLFLTEFNITRSIAIIFAGIFDKKKPVIMSEEQVMNSALPEFVQVYAEKHIGGLGAGFRNDDVTGKRIVVLALRIIPSVWFGSNSGVNLWREGRALPPIIENALVSRIQAVVKQRQMVNKVAISFLFGNDPNDCSPPRAFLTSLFNRLTAIEDVILRGPAALV